jgi:hypothetical protein
MLVEEGLTLLGLCAIPREVLFKDRVIRFSPDESGVLPNHRFNVGDTVKISSSFSNGQRRQLNNNGPLNSGLDGVWYLSEERGTSMCVSIRICSKVTTGAVSSDWTVT